MNPGVNQNYGAQDDATPLTPPYTQLGTEQEQKSADYSEKTPADYPPPGQDPPPYVPSSTQDSGQSDAPQAHAQVVVE